MTSTAQQQSTQRAAAAGAAGAAVAPAAVPAAGGAATVQTAQEAAKAAAVAAILAALVSYLARKRVADGIYLRQQLAARAPRVAASELEALVAEEQRRDEAFALKQSERMAGDTAKVLGLADPVEREAQLKGLMTREQRYAMQRSEAMAARAIAAADRITIRLDSPQGAFWLLDPHVHEHTKGCLVMGGHFWPWAVLERVHPPRHPGCPCRLVGYGQAVADGLMSPSDVPDVRAAIRRAAHVLMEAEPDAPEVGALQEMLAEYERGADELPADEVALREALVNAGLTTREQLEALRGGA